MLMKWFFVNDVIVVYIKIVMEYRLYQVEHGFVNLVLFYDDLLVFFVRSKIFSILSKQKTIGLFLDLVVH